MNIFGIPIFVPYSAYLEAISIGIPQLTNLTDDALFLGYLGINALYIFCLYLFVKMIKFVLMTIWNRWF